MEEFLSDLSRLCVTQRAAHWAYGIPYNVTREPLMIEAGTYYCSTVCYVYDSPCADFCLFVRTQEFDAEKLLFDRFNELRAQYKAQQGTMHLFLHHHTNRPDFWAQFKRALSKQKSKK